MGLELLITFTVSSAVPSCSLQLSVSAHMATAMVCSIRLALTAEDVSGSNNYRCIRMLACVIVMTSVFACEHECVSSACGPDMCIHVAMFVRVRDVEILLFRSLFSL